MNKREQDTFFQVAYGLRHFELPFFILPLIFFHLKMPEEHILKITQSLKTQGNMYYTRPFDILPFDGQIKLIIVPI